MVPPIEVFRSKLENLDSEMVEDTYKHIYDFCNIYNVPSTVTPTKDEIEAEIKRFVTALKGTTQVPPQDLPGVLKDLMVDYIKENFAAISRYRGGKTGNTI